MTSCAHVTRGDDDTSIQPHAASLMVAPAVLLVTMALALRELTERFGFPSGYLMAFVLYWAVWCGAVPVAVLGWRRAVRLFGASAPQFKTLDLKTHALLWAPLVFPLASHSFRELGRPERGL